jgi:hypothetical protein
MTGFFIAFMQLGIDVAYLFNSSSANVCKR